ncbi:MAG TPA: ABC transporter ATP-binding protein [Thermodesulfobacteriota bacterium]|nr:ABC transporter ATP-binding protein [Thermodesulfobacteriota bacterium]
MVRSEETREAKKPGSISLSGRVEVNSISKSYGMGPLRQMVIEDCSFNVESGKLTVLIGPSGCGKTTLINILAGYEAVDSGTLIMNGEPIHGPGWDRLVVFQETALFPWMTTLENVMYGHLVRRERNKKELEAEAMGLLKKVGLADFRDKYPLQLSGGMQRRAELVRALINTPQVMMMDEPFRGLDAMTRELMQEYYLRLFEETQITNLFVTSELEEAIFLADRLIILSNRPARVRKILDINLPRPRELKVLTSDEYLDYKKQALEILHVEAMRAFATGSRLAVADFLEAYAEMGKKPEEKGKELH